MQHVLGAIRARRWALVVGLVAGALLAAALAVTAVPTYASSTQLFVSAANAPDAPSAYQGSLFTQERTPSYVQFLGSTQLAQGVVDELGVPLTAEQVAGKVVAVQVPKTDVIQLTVTDTSPQRAQAIATSLTRQFSRWVTQLETAPGAQASTIKVTTTQPPTFSTTPVSPRTTRDVAIGAALGLLLGLLWALTRERLTMPVREATQVRELTGTAVLGSVSKDRRLSRVPLSYALERSEGTATAVAALRSQLEHVLGDAGSRVVVVTSAIPGEGKSTVAATLAVSIARAGGRVVLVDGNLWRPRVTRYLGIEDAPRGLVDVLTGMARPDEVVYASADARLAVMASGPMPPETTALLGSSAMRELLDVLRGTSDVVLVDAPAVLSTADAAVLGRVADGCLVVARYGTTRADELAEVAETLTAAGARLLGVVLTRVPRTRATSRRVPRPDGDRARGTQRPLPAARRSADEVEPLPR